MENLFGITRYNCTEVAKVYFMWNEATGLRRWQHMEPVRMRRIFMYLMAIGPPRISTRMSNMMEEAIKEIEMKTINSAQKEIELLEKRLTNANQNI